MRDEKIPHPSSLNLYPSSFILHPLSLIPQPLSLNLLYFFLGCFFAGTVVAAAAGAGDSPFLGEAVSL
jgi:hypothetical protein